MEASGDNSSIRVPTGRALSMLNPGDGTSRGAALPTPGPRDCKWMKRLSPDPASRLPGQRHNDSIDGTIAVVIPVKVALLYVDPFEFRTSVRLDFDRTCRMFSSSPKLRLREGIDDIEASSGFAAPCCRLTGTRIRRRTRVSTAHLASYPSGCPLVRDRAARQTDLSSASFNEARG